MCVPENSHLGGPGRVRLCPGFGQDRVNFHQNPGRGTAGWVTQPQPGQTEPGIPYHVPSCWVPVGGIHSRLGSAGAGPVQESGSLGRAVCCCVFSLSVSLLLLFPLFCCSVKLALSRPSGFLPVSFPFSSAPRWGEGRPRGAFVAGCSRNKNRLLVLD